MKTLPLFFHPTTQIIVDDDVPFLQAAWELLGDCFPLLLFDYEPEEAIRKVCKSYAASPLQYLAEDNTNLLSKAVGAKYINFDRIFALLKDPHRFDVISVVVTDYNMPRMNGLEMLSHFPDSGLQRVVLTGNADEQLAVKSFNDRRIEKFITKSPTAGEEIAKTLLEGEVMFFKNAYQSLVPFFDQNAIRNDTYIALCRKLMEENSYIEHYTVSPLGSRLFVDKDGNCTFLGIHNTQELDQIYEWVKDNYPTFSKMKDLEEKNLGLCLWGVKEAISEKALEDHVHPIYRLDDGDLYVIQVDQPIPKEDISPLQQYLDQQESRMP